MYKNRIIPILFSKTTCGRVFITRLSRYYSACTLILLKKRAGKNVFYKMRFKGARLYPASRKNLITIIARNL